MIKLKDGYEVDEDDLILESVVITNGRPLNVKALIQSVLLVGILAGSCFMGGRQYEKDTQQETVCGESNVQQKH